MRKVIQITSASKTTDGNLPYLIALCDDGTLWRMQFTFGEETGWTQITPVPQPPEPRQFSSFFGTPTNPTPQTK